MAQFTKNAIVGSFLKLLNQKPLDKITVKEIVDDCGINRNTFYYHFEDLRALLGYVIDSELELALREVGDPETMEESFIRSAHFALENKRAIYHIYNSGDRAEVERYLFGIAREVVRFWMAAEEHASEIDPTDRELLEHFYTGGLAGIIMTWLESGMKADPEEGIRRLGRLLRGSMEESFRRSLEQ